MHRLIALLMSLFWLLNAVSASAFMSVSEQDDGGFLVPICSGGQIIFLNLNSGGLNDDELSDRGLPDDNAPDAVLAIDCPLLTAMTILPELLAQSCGIEHAVFNDILGLRSLPIPRDQAADRPGARGPPTLS